PSYYSVVPLHYLSTLSSPPLLRLFFFNSPATTEIYTLSLHDALPIWPRRTSAASSTGVRTSAAVRPIASPASDRSSGRWRVRRRSEEHTSELQSRRDLVCRLLLEKKKKKRKEVNNE